MMFENYNKQDTTRSPFKQENSNFEEVKKQRLEEIKQQLINEEIK